MYYIIENFLKNLLRRRLEGRRIMLNPHERQGSENLRCTGHLATQVFHEAESKRRESRCAE